MPQRLVQSAECGSRRGQNGDKSAIFLWSPAADGRPARRPPLAARRHTDFFGGFDPLLTVLEAVRRAVDGARFAAGRFAAG
ncbi:hypothetical protein LMG28727_02847 [Paraburkholderia kirstenboschensis]|nr:hypothetical protein LMG28727_02847 [Paraburkholderia kirstenboschensis]